MEQTAERFTRTVDETSHPVMYGIACTSGQRAERISAHGDRVARLVRACNEGGLSEEHFWDVVEDLLREQAWETGEAGAAPGPSVPILSEAQEKR